MCPICTTNSDVDFFEKNGRTLLICQECRHVFWRQMPTEDELTVYYERVYTGTHSQETLQEQGREYAKSHCRELLQWTGTEPARTTFLDYGCSIPVFLDVARQMGFGGTIGIDPSVEAREYAAARGFSVLPASELSSVADASVDVVRFVHVLEHTINPVATLATVLAKVKPGGVIHLSQPNFPVFAARRSPRDLADTVYPEHLHFFSPISLARMLEAAGLQVRRLFSFQREEECAKTHSDMLDLLYARKKMASYVQQGDNFFPKLGNYPYYAGENSVVWAVKRSKE